MARSLARLSLLLAVTAAPALAQQRNEVTIEGSVIRGALGYARQLRPGTLLGLEAGFGFPQIDRTLAPSQDATTGEPDFEEYLHVAGFVRFRPVDRFEIDTGLRAAIADLWPCGASDCWPTLYTGAYVQPMIGWRHVKVGARLTTGLVFEAEPPQHGGTTFATALTPFIVRGTIPW